METKAVSSVQSQTQTVTSMSAKLMDKDDFLKLLITELRYQDPLNPMDGRDSIAQLAQFSTLEQMVNMTKSLETHGQNAAAAKAFAMIGKKVDYLGKDDVISGTVTGVLFENGWPKLEVGSAKVELSDVARVYE